MSSAASAAASAAGLGAWALEKYAQVAMLGLAMFAEVVMYRTPFCSYCMRAAVLLKRKGVAFREVDVSNDPDTRERLLEQTGSHTVPQIFINGASVGGYDDLATLDRRGALDPLLREAPVR